MSLPARQVIAWAVLAMLSTMATVGDLIEINSEVARFHSISAPHHSRPVAAREGG